MSKETGSNQHHAFRIELHAHTDESIDSRAKKDHVVQRAKLHNLQGFATTDHDTTGAWEYIQNFLVTNDTPLLYLQGIEITTSVLDSRSLVGHRLPHVLVYNIPKIDIDTFLLDCSLVKRKPLVELAEFVKSYSTALVIAPHVYQFGRIDSLSFEDLTSFPIFHAMESHNGKIPHKKEQRKRYDKRVEERTQIADYLGLPKTGVSDAHRARNIGFPATILYEYPSSPQDIVDLVKLGACEVDLRDFRR